MDRLRLLRHIKIYINTAMPIVIVLTVIPLYAGGVLMGNINTVFTEGALDVVRNPALLAFQKKKNALSFSGSYPPYIRNSNSNFGYDSTTNTILVKPKLDESLQVKGGFAYSRKFRFGGAGFAFHNNYEGTQYAEKDYFNVDLQLPGFPPSIKVNADFFDFTQSDEKTITPSGSIAAGFRLTPLTSLGVSVSLAYSRTESKEEHKGMVAVHIPVPTPTTVNDFSTRDVTTREESFTVTAGAGILQKFPGADIGLIIDMGSLSWTKNHIAQQNYDSLASDPEVWKSELTIPYRSVYSSGPGISAGIGLKPFSAFRFAIEFNLIVPHEYGIKLSDSVNINEQSSKNVFYIAENRVSVKTNITMKAGGEFNIFPYTYLSFGGIFNTKVEKTKFVDLGRSTATTRTIAGTAGIEYFYAANSKILCGLQYADITLRSSNGQLANVKKGDGSTVKTVSYSRGTVKFQQFNLYTAITAGF